MRLSDEDTTKVSAEVESHRKSDQTGISLNKSCL